MKHIALLGSTGSIGMNTVEVIRRNPDRFRALYLSTNRNIGLLREQIEQLMPRAVVVLDPDAAATLRSQIPPATEVLTGEAGLVDIVTRGDVDCVVNSLVGFAGLRPTIEAIRKKKDIALANKETLVVAGEIITKLVREYSVKLSPIDSEHSAIFQCLTGEDINRITRLILTASGGPFLGTRKEDLSTVTLEQALKHPNWKMGNKITIDSATMMNKGLEVIEAHWLFGLPPEKIDVVIHPQSIIHSMVEFVDGSIKAQLGTPDMKLPIQYALTYPERLPLETARLDFCEIGQLTFFKPDMEKFRCLGFGFDVMKMGGTAPAVMNAANEIAVDAFLNKRIGFLRIPELIGRALEKLHIRSNPEVEHIFESDKDARRYVRDILK